MRERVIASECAIRWDLLSMIYSKTCMFAWPGLTKEGYVRYKKIKKEKTISCLKGLAIGWLNTCGLYICSWMFVVVCLCTHNNWWMKGLFFMCSYTLYIDFAYGLTGWVCNWSVYMFCHGGDFSLLTIISMLSVCCGR